MKRNRSICFGMIILGFQICSAQSLYNDDALLSLSPGALLSVGQSINNSGTITNQGQILVGQNWLNLGNYADSLISEVHFNGSDNQEISHNDQSFNHITVSGGDKRFTQDFSVLGSLEFQSARLIAQNGSGVSVPSGDIISGAAEDAYIVGSLGISSGATREFPIGTESLYLPVMLDDAADEGLVNASARSGSLSSELDGTLDVVSNEYYWEMSDLSDPSVTLTINFRNGTFLENIDQAVVAQTNSLGGELTSAGSQNVSGSINNGMVTSFAGFEGGFFTLGKRRSGEISNAVLDVLNLVTPNGDNFNDFFQIRNISLFPDNTIVIFDRLGRNVFEASGYDNQEVRFEGFDDDGRELASGTYYYVLRSGGETLASGFLELIW